MTKSIFIIFLSLFLINCGGTESSAPEGTSMDSFEGINEDDLLQQGSFSSVSPYTVNGGAELYFLAPSNTYSIILSDDFFSSSGPDLRVYLAQGATLSNSINLGVLTSTSGVSRFDFPASDYDPLFNNVIIWCEAFSLTFGRALITTP